MTCSFTPIGCNLRLRMMHLCVDPFDSLKDRFYDETTCIECK